MKKLAATLCLMLAAAPAAAQLLSETPQGSASVTVAVAPTVVPSLPERVLIPRDVAVLQVLDKVSARTTKLRVPVGGNAAFGLIMMTVRSCQISPPSETPEAAGFLEISEVDIRNLPKEGLVSNGTQASRLLFSGWMFASSPALSALEHPTYDVSVIACESRTPTAAERAASGEDSPAVQASPAPAELPQD